MTISRDWMTPADVSSSAELTAEFRSLLADESWHSKGEITRSHSGSGETRLK